MSFGDRRLYLVTKPGQAISYPIAVPREQSRWQGVLPVTDKRENPAWTPTPDMIKENPRLPSWVPGGHPMNPLGVRALYLGSSTYRIHGTDAPWTIGQAVSKGCIRMFNEDVLDLYPRVPDRHEGDRDVGSLRHVGRGRERSTRRRPRPTGGRRPKRRRSRRTRCRRSGRLSQTRHVGQRRLDSGRSTAALFDLFTETSEPPRPAKSLTKFNRKVGGGQVSSSAQTTAQAN